MNNGAYIKMVREGRVAGVHGNICYTCGNLRKACYRRAMVDIARSTRPMVYFIMPCHTCNPRLWRQHPLYHSNIEVADDWRDQTAYAMEILRAASPAVATAPPPIRVPEGFWHTTERLETQQAPQPVGSNPEDSVEEEG